MAKLKDSKKVFGLFSNSTSYMEQYTSTFDENERLKEGLPRAGIPAHYPRVTDKTLSKKINDTPKRVFQKLPDFEVDTGADDFTDICVEYVLNEEFIRGEDDGYSFYQKLINVGRNAAAFGMCAVYSPFEKVNGSYRVGFVPIYWGDFYPETYGTNVNVNNYNFIKQWKTEADLDAIIDNEDPDVDDGWNRELLKKLKETHATKSKGTLSTQSGDRKAGISADMYEFITYLSKDEFITFSVDCQEDVLRTKTNNSLRSRVTALYYDFDGENQFGRSMVDIGGDLQNLIDSDMQAYQFNRAIGLQPPTVVSGDLDSGDGIFMPNNVIVSDDPQTAVKVLTVDTTAIAQYPNLYALQKSQMHALIPDASDTTISSESTGGLASSKTSTGIKQNQMTESVVDNFFFKNAEAFLSAWAENAINIYMREFNSIIELKLSKKYADKARAIDPTRITPDDTVMLDCREVTKIRVKVTSGSLRDVARDEDLQRLNSLINMAGQSEIFATTLGTAALQEIAKSIVKTSGVTNAGKIIEAISSNVNPVVSTSNGVLNNMGATTNVGTAV